ncbi:MAG TPA: SDR family NAD(P)-dependent oxidoreductase [Gaiellales bacterium]|nr:SDR family NAD(P)-dependent oxidoreductase [Gaiellales bacterium]
MSDRTAVLTGVTGGWGRAVLDTFLERGWNVVATHRGGDTAPELPAGAVAVAADLADQAHADAAVAAALDRFGSVEALANIAGGFAMGAPIEEMAVVDFQAQMAVNFQTAFNMTRAVLRPMKAAGRGSIVYIGTSAATTPFPNASGYVLSKIALRGLMQVVDVEVRKLGIRANELVVRIVDTPRNRAENPDADFSRWTTGPQLAEVVEWLCSDASAPLSGGSIPAYGRA